MKTFSKHSKQFQNDGFVLVKNLLNKKKSDFFIDLLEKNYFCILGDCVIPDKSSSSLQPNYRTHIYSVFFILILGFEGGLILDEIYFIFDFFREKQD